MYILKKDEHEIRVDFHEANTDYFQVNAGTTFLTENPEAKNYLILTKDEVESFVCLPYETEQKYSKFVGEGDGTGLVMQSVFSILTHLNKRLTHHQNVILQLEQLLSLLY